MAGLRRHSFMLHPEHHCSQRRVRGQSYWLGFLCKTLSFSVSSRFIPALSPTLSTLDRDRVACHPRAEEAGGLSWRPVFEKSTATLRAFASHLGSRIPIIGVGGISLLQDALEKIQAGATLVQIYTSFNYQGPKLVRELARGL